VPARWPQPRVKRSRTAARYAVSERTRRPSANPLAEGSIVAGPTKAQTTLPKRISALFPSTGAQTRRVDSVSAGQSLCGGRDRV
jgi:hypothetical protein